MSYSGMPTPDELLPQTFRCVQIFIPDCVGDEFFSVVMGQLGEMAKEWYWKQEGTLTPEQSAFLMAQSTAMTDANGITCEDTMTCLDVNNCIETDTTTQITINEMLLSLGIVNPDRIEPLTPQMDKRFPETFRKLDTSTPPLGCDKDILWGGILEMVIRLDEIGRDFLQDIVAYNDKAERIANIIDIVPLFGDIAADIITVFSDIAPDLLNAYNAHSSQQVLEDTACALFELVCDECRYPTYEEIYDHYASFGISGIQDIANISITGIMDYLIGSNNLANTFVWYTMNTSVLFTLFLGGTFLNRRGKRWLGIWQKIGEESPSGAWDVLCQGCDTTIILRLSGDGNADIVVPLVGGIQRGIYDPIDDVYDGVSTGSSIEVRIRYVFATSVTLRHTRFDYVNTISSTNRNNLIRFYDSVGTLVYSQQTPVITPAGSYEWSGTWADVKEVEYITAVNNISQFASITKLRLEHE